MQGGTNRTRTGAPTLSYSAAERQRPDGSRTEETTFP